MELKTKTKALLVALLSAFQPSVARTNLLRRNLVGGQPSLITCTGVILEENLGGGITETNLACELNSRIYVIEVDKDWLNTVIETDELVSEETVLSLMNYEMVGATLRSTTGMKNPPGLTRKYTHEEREEQQQRRHLAVVNGTRTVLAINVEHIGPGELGTTIFSEETLSNDIFGDLIEGGNNTINLSSQFSACSNKQLDLQPATTRASNDSAIATDIFNGVTTVRVSTNCTTEAWCNHLMENDVTKALEKAFGVTSPGDLADHVMYCMPRDAMKGVAYAHVNGPISVYRDTWCLALSAQMHEIGHNLGLAHSGEVARNGESKEIYGDKSGMLGYTFADKKGTRMCFNGAKNWQLGWYSSFHHEFRPTDGFWEGNLVGISELNYANNTNTASNVTVIVKINDADNRKDDFYISFNRQTGFNSDTEEGGDRVLIVQRGGEKHPYSQSWRVADLGQGESYTTASDVTVAVLSIDTLVTPAVAKIRVTYPIAGRQELKESYLALQKGRDGSRSIRTIEECKMAGQAVGGALRNGVVVGPGNWPQVPCGCSILSGGDDAIHFKNDFADCSQNAMYTPIMKIEYFSLPEGSDGSNSISTIEECEIAGLKVGGVLTGGRVLGSSNRPDVPCGCSIQTGGNKEIYFNNDHASCGQQGANHRFSPIVRNDDSYFTLPEASGGTDSITTMEECMVAGLSVGGVLGEGAVADPGNQTDLPCGCSIESGPDGNMTIQFQDNFTSCGGHNPGGYSIYSPILKNDYIKLAEGSDGLPNSTMSIEECRVAGLVVGGLLRYGGVVGPGSWLHVPCGCSIQSGPGGDRAIHFKSDYKSCSQPAGLYAPVVRNNW